MVELNDPLFNTLQSESTAPRISLDPQWKIPPKFKYELDPYLVPKSYYRARKA